LRFDRAECAAKSDPECFKRGNDFRFGLSPPQRVFALERRDGLNRVCAADGLCARFREAEVLF